MSIDFLTQNEESVTVHGAMSVSCYGDFVEQVRTRPVRPMSGVAGWVDESSVPGARLS